MRESAASQTSILRLSPTARISNANISANIQGLQIAKNGSPSAKPVVVQVTALQNVQALTGQLQNADIAIGKAIINISGTYQTSGATTTLNLNASTKAASIDELEAFLPSVGVHLPSGSRLQGGTSTTSLERHRRCWCANHQRSSPHR